MGSFVFSVFAVVLTFLGLCCDLSGANRLIAGLRHLTQEEVLERETLYADQDSLEKNPRARAAWGDAEAARSAFRYLFAGFIGQAAGAISGLIALLLQKYYC